MSESQSSKNNSVLPAEMNNLTSDSNSSTSTNSTGFTTVDNSNICEEIIDLTNNTVLKEGDIWYLIDGDWWESFVNKKVPPGNINTKSLLDDNNNLKPINEIKIQPIPKSAWLKLLCIVQLESNSLPILRKVVNTYDESSDENSSDSDLDENNSNENQNINDFLKNDNENDELEETTSKNIKNDKNLVEKKSDNKKKNLLIEYYPPNLNLHLFPAKDYNYSLHSIVSSVVSISASDSFQKLRLISKLLFQLPTTSSIRLWTTDSPSISDICINAETFANLSNKLLITDYSKKINFHAKNGDNIIVEMSYSDDDDWPSNQIPINTQITINHSLQQIQSHPKKPLGSLGLNNLGNTCYMNSALQCVTHVKELTYYFLDNLYKDELNYQNPIGMDGNMANAYANLVHKLFNPDSTTSSIAPRELKSVVGRYGTMFSGYGQQDSQEFLAFLLDGLHEDLNRIVKKPYVEKPESTDETVKNPVLIQKLADKCWEIHKARNDSIIQDLFAGLYKSTLVCPVCKKISITFDPYLELSLALPIQNFWSHEIVVVPANSSPVKIEIEMDSNSSIGQFKQHVAKKLNLNSKRLIAAEIFRQKIYQFYEDFNSLSASIRPADTVFVYELDEDSHYINKNSNNLTITVFSSISTVTSIENNDDDDDEDDYNKYHSDKPINTQDSFLSFPFFIVLTEEEATSYQNIYSKLVMKYKSLFQNSLKDAKLDQNLLSMFNTFSKNNRDCSEIKSETLTNLNSDNITTFKENTNVLDLRVLKSNNFSRYPMSGWSYNIDNLPKLFKPKDSNKNYLKKKSDVQIATKISDIEDKVDNISPIQNKDDIIDKGETINTLQLVPKYLSSSGEDEDEDEDEDEEMYSPPNSSEDSNLSSNKDQDENISSLLLKKENPEHNENEDKAKLGSVQESLPSFIPKTDVLPIKKSDASLPIDISEDDFKMAVDSPMPLSDTSSTLSSSSSAKSIHLFRNNNGANSNEENFLENNDNDKESLLHDGDGIVCGWSKEILTKITDNYGKVELGVPNLIHDNELEEKRKLRSSKGNATISVEDCLDLFSKEEILGANDLWFCPKCSEHRQASKTFELWRVPDVFTIHLKRFSSSRTFSDKIDEFVSFPIEGLDLSKWMGSTKINVNATEDLKNDNVYDLFAVDNHYGGLGGGHYTSYVKNFVDNQWYYFDDSSVTPCTAEESVTNAAYLLFYRKRSSKPLGNCEFATEPPKIFVSDKVN